MDESKAIHLMSALAQPTRMSVFLTLAKHGPNGLPVGEIARLVDTPPNTMSTHLSILARAGAVVSNRAGRVVSYSVVPTAVRDLALFLVKGSRGDDETISDSFVTALNKACAVDGE